MAPPSEGASRHASASTVGGTNQPGSAVVGRAGTTAGEAASPRTQQTPHGGASGGGGGGSRAEVDTSSRSLAA
eukprot:6686851-Prymnesium_polylepis.1